MVYDDKNGIFIRDLQPRDATILTKPVALVAEWNGSGGWYRDEIREPYADCRNDDDLVLYLS